jgi:hypothetical protein
MFPWFRDKKAVAGNPDSDFKAKIHPRFQFPTPFPQAPVGKEGFLGVTIAVILLGSFGGIYIFFRMIGEVIEYNHIYLFYFSMMLVNSIYGILCAVLLLYGETLRNTYGCLFLVITLYHNLYYWHKKPWILMAKYIVVISGILIVYLLVSKRVRNTYLWEIWIGSSEYCHQTVECVRHGFS